MRLCKVRKSTSVDEHVHQSIINRMIEDGWTLEFVNTVGENAYGVKPLVFFYFFQEIEDNPELL